MTGDGIIGQNTGTNINCEGMKMEIKVEVKNDMLICPLQGDRRECKAIKNSPVNFCPAFYDDEDEIYRPHFPENCPLLNESITIKKEG